MIYGSQDCSVSYRPYSRLPEGVGLFGGYPAGIGGIRAIFHTEGPAILARLKEGEYPTRPEEIEEANWGKLAHPAELRGREALPEFSIVADFVAGGAGYGDPLERRPDSVAKDVRARVVSLRVADRVYGVAMDPTTLVLDRDATETRRQMIRGERLREGTPYSGLTSSFADHLQTSSGWKQVLKFHEVLEVARNGRTEAIRCTRCGHLFCEEGENYKLYALRRVQDLYVLAQQRLPSGEPYLGGYYEYYCPACATLLQVDIFCSLLPGSHEPLPDFRPKR